jgi:TatA/E family protein of Tat protein translocase
MFGFSFWEIMMVLVIALVVLGPKRLPALAKTLGSGLRKLQQASGELKSAIEEPLNEVRKPLEDMRDDLMSTVHKFEDDVQNTMSGAEKTLRDTVEKDPYADEDHDPYASPPDDDPEDMPTEIDDRRREVEALYAASAAEDEADDPLLGDDDDDDDGDADGWDPDGVGDEDEAEVAGEVEVATHADAADAVDPVEERVPATPPTAAEEASTTVGFATAEEQPDDEDAQGDDHPRAADPDKATGA